VNRGPAELPRQAREKIDRLPGEMVATAP